MKLVNNFVLIEHIREVTKDGIISLVTSDVEKHSVGKVAEISKSVDNMAVGDEVIYHEFSGIEMSVDGKKYLAVDKNHILCVIVGDGVTIQRGFKMTTDRIIVKQTKSDEEDGIIKFSSSDRIIKTSGEVIAVSDKVDEVTKGDVVLFSKMGGVNIIYGDAPYKILSVKEILAVV